MSVGISRPPTPFSERHPNHDLTFTPLPKNGFPRRSAYCTRHGKPLDNVALTLCASVVLVWL